MPLRNWVLLTALLLTDARLSLSISKACSKVQPDGPQAPKGSPDARLLILLARKVDDPHPYYKRIRITLKTFDTPSGMLTSQFADGLTAQLNITDIERIVLNDLMVITSDADLLALECDDRLEVFYRGSGPPTRALTFLAGVEGVRTVGLLSILPYARESGLDSSNYLLLFTISSGVGTSIWFAYNAASGNASTPSFLSADTAGDTGQPALFRSDALDNLDELRFRLKRRELLLVVYDRAGQQGLRLTFDLDGAPRPLTRQSWFSQSRLMSSWPVANVAARSSFNFFSIEGDIAGGIRRRFFINYNYGSCPNDSGLLVAMDVADICDYARAAFTAAPLIAYTTSADGSWLRGIHLARRLSIFVR